MPELAEPQFPLPASDIRRALAHFDKLFHLPATRLRVVKPLAPSESPWLANGEEVLDTGMVHASAPRAAIVEILVKGTSLRNNANAAAASVAVLRLGTSCGNVTSISAAGQTGGEDCDSRAERTELHAALQDLAKHDVTAVAASYIGAVGEPCAVFKGLTGGSSRRRPVIVRLEQARRDREPKVLSRIATAKAGHHRPDLDRQFADVAICQPTSAAAAAGLLGPVTCMPLAVLFAGWRPSRDLSHCWISS